MAESSDPREKLPLVDLYHQFGLDYEYRADGVGDLPYLSHALSQPGETILHSFGALRALEELRRLLSPGGFILASDYPWLQHPLERLPYQHFGGSTAIGVNFPLLESYFQRDPEVTWIEPEGRQAGARLLGWRLAPAVAACFGNLFSAEALRWEAEPLENARKYRESGRTDAAHCSYTEALRRQPRNWALIAEAARFLVSQVQDYPAGLALARAAIELNPIHPDPWNTLGDAHFALGQIEEARSAFERAVEIRPDDVRGYYNLMYTCSKRGDLRAALRMAAEALAHDRSGEYRDQILQRQSEILAHLRRLSAERENRLRDR
jgi:tetratricopeptide (TPR) repeat protein